MLRLFLILITCLSSSILLAQNTAPYSLRTKEKVGYIKPDTARDNPNFTVCDENYIQEYYQVNPQYKEGVISIKNYFKPKLEALNELAESDGIIVIRFVINCQGLTGRFRSKYFDENYIKKDQNTALQNALVDSISAMGYWLPGKFNDQFYDAYQHIKFRIKDKKIIDVFL
ncbi:hypothetical protein GCM10027429_24980 [Marivirga atlantica]|jgi:hypothetical protein|uniref:TonB C-terminal domain-containing protein n=1 Tax=Marivirga atlantica TaxID=1548457 RepID=A0A937DHN1_9BACT|nr:hypothetical protein [Marivirga atlantica]MBL0766098.1 hypothetical protein [Marivirga atlantica]